MNNRNKNKIKKIKNKKQIKIVKTLSDKIQKMKSIN